MANSWFMCISDRKVKSEASSIEECYIGDED